MRSRSIRLILGIAALAVCALVAAPVRAQEPAAPWVVDLDGAWKFQPGDDPAWAGPTFDDAGWADVKTGESWVAQGFADTYGFVWFRRTVDVPPSLAGQTLGVHVSRHRFSVEVFANGVAIGKVGEFPPDSFYASGPTPVYRIPPDLYAATNRVTIAIRVWHPPGTAGTQYAYPGLWSVRFGNAAAVDTLTENEWHDALFESLPQLVLFFLFLIVGLYHILLYWQRRVLVEYLWFGVLAITLAFNTVSVTAWSLIVIHDRMLQYRITNSTVHFATAAGVQFVWTFLGHRIGKWLRGYQIFQIALAVLVAVWPDPRLLWGNSSVLFLTILPVLLAVLVVVARDSWRGSPDARMFAFGAGCFVLAKVVEASRILTSIAIPTVVPYGFLIVLLSMALALSSRFSRVYAQIDALNRDLEKKVEDRTADLRTANEQLAESEQRERKANRAKSAFLSSMSHELRTPLNAILGFAQILDRDRTLTADQRASIATIARSGRHLLGLINDVLSISKIEAGKISLDERAFDLAETLRIVEEMTEIRARSRKLAFEIEHAPDLPRYVVGDEGKLRQILINLLGNAVKFTDRGHVGLATEWHDGVVTFRVTDTGPGISEDEREKLFEPFLQTETGFQSREGTGLGLSISRDLARLMGGDISVESALGKGSTFTATIRLPMADEAPAQERRHVVRLAAGQTSPRILVVDDTPENRAVLAKLLVPVGFDVREAANGEDALRLWAAWHPDLIFMDMRMPVLDGYEATKIIRRSEVERTGHLTTSAPTQGRATRIISLTASAFDHDRDAILAAGCDDFVTKPFRQETIFDKLAEHLGVAYEYESDEPSEEERAQTVLASADALRAMPPEWITELTSAVELGDIEVALGVVDRMAKRDTALAEHLRGLLRGYMFDEVLELAETARRGAASAG